MFLAWTVGYIYHTNWVRYRKTSLAFGPWPRPASKDSGVSWRFPMCGACRVHLLAHIDTHPTEPLVYIPLNPIARLDSPSTAARDFEFQMSPVLGRRRPEVTDGGPTTARRRDAMTMGDGKTQNARVQLHPAWRTPGQSRPAGCGCAEAGSFKEGSPQQEERIPSPRVACSFPRSWSPGLSTPGLLATLASSFHPAAGGAGGGRIRRV